MRSVLSGVAGLLAVVLLPVAILVGWVSTVGTDTDRFVSQMRPVASSPEVREALTERMIDAAQAQLNLPAALAQQLEAPLGELVGTVLQQPEVERGWEAGLRDAHHEFVAVMEGGAPARVDSTGHVIMTLTIELTGLERLLGRFGLPVVGSLSVAPEVPITLFFAADLAAARRVYGVGAVAGSAAPWVVVALAVAGLLFARHRLRAAALLGVGGIVASVAAAGVLVLGRDASADLVPDPVGSAVISAAYQHAEDGLLGATALALWVSAGLLSVAVILGVTRVIFGRRG